MAIDLILGTAGHIDHGKTSLVRALTGTDTDRLPEEKRRGITIELGFAELPLGEYRLGIVDVPGHEKFVRQMLAGATGMDLALLVVAADDSVKPQTREHMDVLRLLDLPAGVIALTKCDLAEDEWIDLVESEVRDLVQGTFLADAEIVRTSSETGLGLDGLKRSLVTAAQKAQAKNKAASSDGDSPFRMAIDRSFTIAGHGTVVTGSVSSGSAAVGDTVIVQPDGLESRIRSLNNHGREVDSIQRGQRSAINLAGIHHEQISRGHELASPGHLLPSTLVTVSLHVLADSPRPLKNRATVRFHLGTAEVLATISLLVEDQLTAGSHGFAQLFLRDSVAAVWNQPFVIRSESPVMTIGGGRVLVPNAKKLRPGNDVVAHLGALATSGDELERVASAAFFAGFEPWISSDLPRMAGANRPDDSTTQLTEKQQLVAVEVSPRRTSLLHAEFLQIWTERILRTLKKLHDEQPMRSAIDVAKLTSHFAYIDDPHLMTAIVKQMSQAGQLRQTKRGVAHPEHKLKLSKPQQALLEEIIHRYESDAFQPPSVAEYQKELPQRADDISKLVQVAVAEEQLVHITSDLYLHDTNFQQMFALLNEAFDDRSEGLTVSDIRELLQTTRKFAVPICEHLDRIGFTKRQGDVRIRLTKMKTDADQFG